MPVLAGLVVVAVFLAMLSLPTHAQNAPATASTPPADSAQAPAGDQTQDQSSETLKVNVEVVQLFFNVKDKRGALIPNLAKDNFDIFEDGKQQTIKYFKAESDLPLTLGILIDS
ncbi:MAG: VWA domain-containing protein, partial [Terriglobales bacterium]